MPTMSLADQTPDLLQRMPADDHRREILLDVDAACAVMCSDGYPVPTLFLTDDGIRAEWSRVGQSFDVSVDFDAQEVYAHWLSLMNDQSDDAFVPWARRSEALDAVRAVLIKTG